VDNFSPYSYRSEVKRKNWAYVNSVSTGAIRLYDVDLLNVNFSLLLKDVTHVVHLAAIPGQSKSWTLGRAYWENNVVVTHLLLEELYKRDIKLIFASSSSVYGDVVEGDENIPRRPISPYGVTKLASEDLIDTFENAEGGSFKSVTLRLFSVYGPMQRPDMGIYRFIDSLIKGSPIEVFGDGSALRTFTFVDDATAAIISCIKNDSVVGKFNICGNQTFSVLEVIATLSEILERTAQVHFLPVRVGDQKKTKGIALSAESAMGFVPALTFKEGLRQQVVWHEKHGEST
jgi:nucleoside-diphosphate-sugar epimerase